MPNPAMPSIVTGAAGILDSVVGGIFQASANKKNRQFALQQYERERKDALADWNMNNLYNSPGAQMARLKEAGLNPNLVYGNGGSIMQAATVRDADMGNYQQQPLPGTKLGESMAQIYNIKLQQAQVDNVKALTEVAKVEAGLKAVQALKTLMEKNTGQFDLDRKEELKQIIFEQASSNLGLTKSQIDLNVHGNQRAEELYKLDKQIKQQQLIGEERDNARRTLDNAMQRMQNGQFEQMRPIQLAQAKAEVEHIQARIKETLKNTENLEQLKRLNKMEADAGKLINMFKTLMGGAKR